MKNFYLGLYKLLSWTENFFCALGLIFCTIATVVQIINRYWLHYEIMWIADFVLYIFVLTSILTIIITTRESAHTTVDIVVERLFRGRVSKIVSKICINLCSLYIIYLLMPTFYKYFLKALKFDEWGTLCPWFNTSWLIESIFIMFVLCSYHIVHNIGAQFIDLCSKKQEKGATA